MRLPKKSKRLLKFKHNNTWYQITDEVDKFALYRCESDTDYTYLGSGNSPVKLETRVYDGKLS
jgi:hypothetical protein